MRLERPEAAQHAVAESENAPERSLSAPSVANTTSYPPKEVTAPTNRAIGASRSQEGNGISPSYTESSTDQHLISLHRHQSAAPSSTFPSLFFLDSRAFEYGKYTIEKPLIVLPNEYLCYLGDSAETQNSMNRFFATVHSWFPIVSKLQFSQQQLELQNQGSAETELILMVMELLNQTLGERPSSQTELYRSIKLCYSYLEMHNVFSIRLLQAAVLIALYEVANAMYPVAYLTVGHCARLGHAIGLHRQRQAPQMLPTPDTWREAEERRRVWWAIIILDRYVNIGNRHHPFASEDAMPGDFLPVDDQSWDQGELTVNQPLVVSTSASIHAFPFARACQSAHLLSRVIRHMNETEMDPEFRFQEALQLHRTVQALALSLRNESQELATNENCLAARQLFTAVALGHSARLHLYNMYSCIDISDVRGASSAERMEMQKIAITGLEDVSAEVFGFAKTIRQAIELEGLSKTSILRFFMTESSDMPVAATISITLLATLC
ncbi:hypothetical protein BPAE_0060g00060 [Botrytis paeoniae]|uniref:Xylanolytic transcriptional activator regulatory domain-containing protein n=1 Tax=Botrytis paeoniae TaxID=278948 RepID=A0A4Z1FXG1_9HELO|nr:hypothetical protein BPAE_0060g00060 [Botrytis paeoniae]